MWSQGSQTTWGAQCGQPYDMIPEDQQLIPVASITTNIYNIASELCVGGLCFCAAYYKCFDEIEYGLLSIPYSSIPTFGSPTKVVSSPLPHLSSTLADGCSAAQRARHDGLRGDATRSRVLPTEPYGFFSTHGALSSSLWCITRRRIL